MTEARRVLILAPHPDDETVACGIAAARAASAGARVFILYLTTGVPEVAALWPWRRSSHAALVRGRRDEARQAAALLGLEPLRFRDLPTRRLRYDLAAAAADIAAAIADTAAEALWVPAFEGAHQDHDAANALAATFHSRLPVTEFAAYNFAGGRVHSNLFPGVRGGEFTLDLMPHEAELKRRALACYRSERGNLAHIGISRETGRPLPDHDYGAPPHPGRLFRERFHWVPFRHPRVDFDRSADVYRDLVAFVSARASRPTLFGDQPGDETGQTDREFAGALDQAQRQHRIG